MFSKTSEEMAESLGLLLLRLGAGGLMLFAHGMGKLLSYGEKLHTFSDPLGVSSPVSLSLAVFAEVFCPIAIILGVRTRLASIPPLFTMIVAAVIVHGQDPWARKELAVVYALAFLVLICTGGGRFAMENMAAARRGRAHRWNGSSPSGSAADKGTQQHGHG